MKLNVSKEWCIEAAKREGDAEVGAGFESMPIPRMRTVRAFANRGREYDVVFDDGGEIVSVASINRRGRHERPRLIWHRQTGREMTGTAICAVRSARAKLADLSMPRPHSGSLR